MILRILVLGFAGAAAALAGPPRGEYVELHSCEVYTGGCIASAQAPTEGRAMLRVWHFDQGAWTGQTLAVLETAQENLAFKDARPTAGVAYLPEAADAEQREAMLAWLKENGATAGESRVVPISYRRDGSEITVAVGKSAAFSTRAIEACDAGSCGEQLWYAPRSRTAAFIVLVNRHSQIEEPALALSWKDHGAKSIFFGRFGEPDPAEFTLASLP